MNARITECKPRLGLNILASMDIDRLFMAIVSGDVATLTSIPGIGKKTADRLILELKDKLDKSLISQSELSAIEGNSDIVAALTSLGYSLTEASRAISSLPPEPMSIEEKIKIALKYLSSR